MQVVMNACLFNGCPNHEWLPGRVFTVPPVIDIEGAADGQTEFVVDGTQIEFNAIPSPGAMFAGFRGAEISQDRVVEYTWRYQNPRSSPVENQYFVFAYFAAPVMVTVEIASGSGTITSIPPGIACSGGTCTASFARYSVILLRADRSATWSGSASCVPGTLCEVGVDVGTTVNVTLP
jgi:hypothetical protein